MKRGLRGRRLGFSLLSLVAAAMLAYTGDSMWLWVLLLQAVILALGAGHILLTLYLMRLNVKTSAAAVTSGGTLGLTLSVHNETALPFCHLALYYSTALSTFDFVPRVFYAAVPPFSETSHTFTLSLPYRGDYKIGVTTVEAVDLFGLVRIKRRHENIARIAAYPKMGDSAGSRTGQKDEGSLLSNRMHTEELSQVSDIRDYRDGDPLRRIHWKLSARFRKLLVKDYAGSLDIQSEVFLDCSRHGLLGTEAAVYEERLCSAAATFCRVFYERGQQLRLVTFGAERGELKHVIKQEEFLLHLARVKFGGESHIAHAVRIEADAGAANIVLVTREPSGELNEVLCALADSGCAVTLVMILRGDTTAAQSMADELRRHGIDVIVSAEEVAS